MMKLETRNLKPETLNFLFAWRYFKSKKSTNAVNIIAWTSVIAIAVGTSALIIVLSVFNGFEGLVKSLYSDFYADIRIAPAKGKTITLSAEQISSIEKTPGVVAMSLVAEEKSLLMNDDAQTIVSIKGVDENYLHVTALSNHIVRGKFDVGNTLNPKLIVGAGVEDAINIDVEKSVRPLLMYMPGRKAGALNSIEGLHSYNAYAAGTFLVQQDFDNKYVFTNLAFVQYMLDMKADEYSSVEIKLSAHANTDLVQQSLKTLLGNGFNIQTRYQQNQSLYTVMQVERWVIYAILSLILIVAAFNMIGALTMLVLEKQKDIAVLKAMGADNRLIQKIFLSEGFVLAGIGGGSGLILATFICLIQIKFHLIKLGGGSFIIDYYPVQLSLFDFILVFFTVLVITVLAAWVPSRKASLQEFSLKS